MANEYQSYETRRRREAERAEALWAKAFCRNDARSESKPDRRPARQGPKNPERDQRYCDLMGQGLPVKAAKRLGIKLPGSGKPKRLAGRNGKADQAKVASAAKARIKVSDRRRFKTTPVPTGEPAKKLVPDHPAVMEGRTVFPSTVRAPGLDDRVFKDGANNVKIGGDVAVGRLKGAKIFTLTLEERATCPRSCQHWRTCYGSGMQLATRWRHGPALEARIVSEIAELCAKHKKVLVRLHVLGDFYSTDYVSIWAQLLAGHKNLYVFGFTAWAPDTAIGDLVAQLRKGWPRQWYIRHSGRTGSWGSFTIDFPTERKRIGDAVVCPEQLDAMNDGKRLRHCGNCGVCWSTDRPVVFVEH